MPKVPDYTAIGNTQGTTALKNDDEFYVYGNGASRKITAKELGQALSEKTLANAPAVDIGYGKSDLYRGANLGSGSTFATASTAAQRAAIASGTFEGLFIGDYWTVNNVLYRIADFNYWKRSGDTDFNTNHVVLLPDSNFGNDKMNASNTTTGAYVGSKMYTDSSSSLNVARSKIASDFGGYLATHKEYLANAVSEGAQTAGAWFDSTVDLMNELMVYGYYVRCQKSNGTYLNTIDKDQLALFKLNPAMVNLRYSYWLRDVTSAATFAHVRLLWHGEHYRRFVLLWGSSSLCREGNRVAESVTVSGAFRRLAIDLLGDIWKRNNMSRLSDYPAIGNIQGTTGLSNDDVFYVDGSSGSRKITAKELAQAVAEKTLANAASVGVGYGKSGLYRGANLGSGATFAAASTAAQKSAIANGTFEGLFIGDYWTVNNVLYRIADFNYWKRSGDTDFNTNHIVLVPDTSFGSGPMNDSNDTTGAYVGSKMYTDSSSVLNTARTKISTDFGGYLASHKVYLPNAISNGAQSAGAWYTSTVELMNEPMVYGTYIRCKDNGGFYLNTIDKAQLALFRLNPAMVNLRSAYWLRDVSSATSFASVATNGYASNTAASISLGVRPAFAVKGTA